MTTTLTIYRLTSQPDRLFAHFIQSDTLNLNGVERLDAERVFLAVMESTGDAVRDRHNIHQLAREQLSKPKSRFIGLDPGTGAVITEPLPTTSLQTEWDDTHEMWDA